MDVRGHRFAFLAVMVALASFFFVGDAMAQVTDLHDPSKAYTGLLDMVKASAGQWDDRLRGYAMTLFWLLASIQFVWTFAPLVFKQADLGEILGELFRFIMIIGFFYALLLFSAEWAEAVVDSFRTAGATAAGLGSSGLRPGDIFGAAVEMANTVADVKTMNPITAFMVSLAALVVLLSFAFIAAFMGLTIIESYVVINASTLFMGFGASQWTREYAIAIVRYAVAVGAKLFTLTLIVGLVVDSAKLWASVYQNDDASMWTMVGLSLACAYLAKTIPELIAGMISGQSMGGGSSLGGMAAAAVAGAAAAAATIATAGAAAPAAAGIAGAAGSGAAGAGAAGAAGGAAAGSGGLAGAINSATAGGAAPGAASGAASSGLGASTGGSAAAKTAGAKTGGSAAQASGAPSGASAPGSGAQQAAKQAGKATQGGEDEGKKGSAAAQPAAAPTGDSGGSSGSAPAAPSESGGGLSGHAIASGATRAAGILSAISVPGMEGAAGLSLGAGAPQGVPGADSNNADADMEVKASEPQNVIRPAEPQTAPVAPADTKGEGDKP